MLAYVYSPIRLGERSSDFLFLHIGQFRISTDKATVYSLVLAMAVRRSSVDVCLKRITFTSSMFIKYSFVFTSQIPRRTDGVQHKMICEQHAIIVLLSSITIIAIVLVSTM